MACGFPGLGFHMLCSLWASLLPCSGSSVSRRLSTAPCSRTSNGLPGASSAACGRFQRSRRCSPRPGYSSDHLPGGALANHRQNPVVFSDELGRPKPSAGRVARDVGCLLAKMAMLLVSMVPARVLLESPSGTGVSWVPRLATPAESPGEFASAISRASLRLCQFSPIPPLRLSGLCMGPKREKYGLELAPRDGPTRVTATALDWLALCRGALPAVANGRVSIPPLPSHPAVGKQRVALSKGLLPAAPRIGCIWPEAHPPRSGDARRACGAGCRM